MNSHKTVMLLQNIVCGVFLRSAFVNRIDNASITWSAVGSAENGNALAIVRMLIFVCGDRNISYNLSKPALPELPGTTAPTLAGRSGTRGPSRALLPRRFHRPTRTQRAGDGQPTAHPIPIASVRHKRQRLPSSILIEKRLGTGTRFHTSFRPPRGSRSRLATVRPQFQPTRL